MKGAIRQIIESVASQNGLCLYEICYDGNAIRFKLTAANSNSLPTDRGEEDEIEAWFRQRDNDQGGPPD